MRGGNGQAKAVKSHREGLSQAGREGSQHADIHPIVMSSKKTASDGIEPSSLG